MNSNLKRNQYNIKEIRLRIFLLLIINRVILNAEHALIPQTMIFQKEIKIGYMIIFSWY